MRIRLVHVAPALAFAGLVTLMGLYLHEIDVTGRNIAEVPSVLIDRPAPQFALPPVPGVDRPGLATADLAGRVTLVNVFASWCLPCRIEHPALEALAREGVRLVGISYKDRPEDAAAFLAELGNPFERIGADPKGRTAIDWGVYGVPETFILDQSGRVRYRQVGPIDPVTLERTIRPILAEIGS